MRKKLFVSILVMLIYSIQVSWSQNVFQQLKIQQWNTKQGMPNDLILNVYQSKDGFIYMTGYSGLVRFDGVTFKSFNSRNNSVFKTDNIESLITETTDSTIWIPTPASGLLAFKNGKLTQYLKEVNTLFLYGTSITDEILLSRGRGSNLFILFNTRTKNFKEINDVAAIELFRKTIIQAKNQVDKSGNQWRMFRGKVYRIKDGNLYELTEKEGIEKNVGFFNFYVDNQGRVWLPSTKGLMIWNGSRFSIFPGMQPKAMMSSNVSAGLVLEDRKGGIWAITQAGLAYLTPGSEQFVFNSQSSPISTQNFNNLLEDNEGNLFLSSDAGLFKLSYSKFINYSQQDGFTNNRISAVCALDNHRYLAANKGRLFVVEDGNVKPYVFKNESLAKDFEEVIHLYKDSKENIWVCGITGRIFKLTNNGEKVYETPAGVRYAYEDEQKNMWFALQYAGIAFINNKDEVELLNLSQVDFKTTYISSIRKLQNGNWMITSYNKGAFIIDQQGKPKYLSEDSKPSSIGVFNGIEDPDGTIWLVTQSGIKRYKNKMIKTINAASGLPENSIFGFLPDNKGYVWFPSNHGLIRAKKQELNDYLDNKIQKINWQLYDDGDGMLNRQCVGARHSAITPDGKILVPTFGGLVEVDPNKLTKNLTPPSVVIHNVLRDDQVIDLSKENKFDPGSHRYIFEYSGLSLTAPEKVRFKFRLIGYDKDWITAVGDRKAFYTNLPAGNYTFQVIAANNDGVWNEKGATYSFSINPPWWRTWWAYLIYAFALIAVLFAADRIQRRRLIQKEREKAKERELQQAREIEKAYHELKKTQAQLIQQEKMASLGELTAGIAHEIQNPLNFVNNFSETNIELIEEMKDELAKSNGHPDSYRVAMTIAKDIKENEQKILHHGKRADAIVKGMLQHSRKNNGQKESTDINALADEYLRLSYHGLRAKDKSFNAHFTTDFDEGLSADEAGIGKIEVAPQDIGRVLLNLYNNAFYSVNEKKKRLDGTFKPTVSVSTKRENGNVIIKVSDNGTGIPQKVLSKIYQPFFTTKPTGEGTGLGLSLSYDIVKAHGGELQVETKEGEGSNFKISLPV